MNILDKLLLHYLRKAALKPMPSEGVSTDNKNNDYYSITIENFKDKRNYHITCYQDGIFTCKLSRKSTDEESIEISLNESEIVKKDIKVKRYFKDAKEVYEKKESFIFNEIFNLIWPKYIWAKTTQYVNQKIVNRKRIETASQLEVLKIIKKHDAEMGYKITGASVFYDEGFTNKTFLIREYGYKIINRPDYATKQKEIEMILESLLEDKLVKETRGHYQVTGKGLNEIIEKQKESTRHAFELWNKIIMTILTLALAIGTLIQSGIV